MTCEKSSETKPHLILTADIVEQPVLVQGNSNRRCVSTLKPCAKDAYMLFQVFPLLKKIIFVIEYSFVYIFDFGIFGLV